MLFSVTVILYLGAILGIFLSPWRLVRLALFMGLFGALPGFLIAVLRDSLRTPSRLGPAPAAIKMAAVAVAPYLFFGVPLLFGPYCAAVAFVGGFLIMVSQKSPQKWLEPALIVSFPLLAAVPMSLLGWSAEAFGASAFWGISILVFRRRIFGDPAVERSPRFESIYRWMTNFRWK